MAEIIYMTSQLVVIIIAGVIWLFVGGFCVWAIWDTLFLTQWPDDKYWQYLIAFSLLLILWIAGTAWMASCPFVEACHG